MSAVLAWLRLDLRRRWRPLAVLALLIAVASGTVLAATAGARRGESALPRLTARTSPATAMVMPNQTGFDWDEIRALPEVDALSTFMLGADFPIKELPGSRGLIFPPGDGEAMRTIERPVLLSGRLPDPDRADEGLASPQLVREYGVRLGDVVSVRLGTPQQVKAARNGQRPGPPAGPLARIRIVGVGFSMFNQDQPGSRGAVQPTRAFGQQYRSNFYDETTSYTNAIVRLRGGEAALPRFQERLAAVTSRPDIDVLNWAEVFRQRQRSYTFQARCLLAFGGIALIAAIVLVGQAVARHTASSVADLHLVRALGMTPRQAVGAAAAGPVLAAAAGTTLGTLVAGASSLWFPIGSAALIEPSPGLDLDWTVLAAGWVGGPLLVLAGSAAAGALALRSQSAPGRVSRSVVASLAARAGLPVPVVIGTQFALEAGRGPATVPVRPALLGAVAGVLGVLAAFTFSAGVSDASTNLARFGQTWQLEAYCGYNGRDLMPTDRVLAAVARDRDVIGVNDARLAVAHTGRRDTAVTMFTYQPVGRPVRPVLTTGRMPTGDAEVVLAPTTASTLGARPGSLADFGEAGGVRRLRVVGIGFVPSSPHTNYNQGGWLTSAGYDALFGRGFKFHTALIAFRPGADPDTVVARLRQIPGTGELLYPPEVPEPVSELRQVRPLPLALGIFLALLAIGAVGHALATAVRRRRHDIAVLRALGMTRWQSRSVVITQASVLAAVGLLFGIPLGLALGRALWRVVADYTPLAYVPPFALLALLLVGPLALLLANALAAWPGQQAARLRIAHILRAE